MLAHGLPLFHVHGLVLGLLGPLRLGGELRHLVRFEPQAAAAALRDGATLLFGVPTMYHRLGARPRRDDAIGDGLKHARLLVSGSAPLPAPEFDAHARAERAGDRRALRPHRDADEHRRARGRRAPPRLRRPAGAGRRGAPRRRRRLDVEASDDETIGEVAVRGPNLFSDYLNRPEATAEAVRDGWFFTGDIATRAPDG